MERGTETSVGTACGDAAARGDGSARAGTVAIGAMAVHAWLVDLDPPGAVDRGCLDASERARAASYLRPQDGARFAASRAALREVLSRYVGGEPGRLVIGSGPRGQPRLAGDGLRFSLTRSGHLALVAVALGPVGADLERLEPRLGLADAAAARFAARETACIAAGCGGSWEQGFYRHWTAKEAYLKATGLGLAGLRDTELVCGSSPVIWFAGRPVAGWSLSAAQVGPRYLAAVVGRQPVTSWRWLSPGRPATLSPLAG